MTCAKTALLFIANLIRLSLCLI